MASVLTRSRWESSTMHPTHRLIKRSLYKLLFFIAAAISTSAAAFANDSAKRPNILFIYADDQSYKTLSCYDGHPDWVKTPNIDRFATTGVRFERSYLGPWCMPSRASLLTGRLQHAIMSMSMEGEYPGSKYDPAQCPFVPAQFRANGYHTAQIGKWHTGTDTGYGRDWDHQIVWNRPLHPENAGNYYTGQILTFNGVDKLTDGYSTDNYTKYAIDYIQGKDRDPNKPWYLWLCYGAIHGPTTPADRHKGHYKGNAATVPVDIVGPRADKPAYLEDTQAWVIGRDGKAAMAKKSKKKDNFDGGAPGKKLDAWVQQVNECMMAVDEGVGKVLKALEASGQLDNTLIVYSADQGFGLGEHGFSQKVAPYDATVSSPLIVSWAGKIPAGKVCKHPVNSPDLVNLFCRVAEVQVPWKTHGRDIWPLLENPETKNWNSPVMLTHTSRNYGAETAKIPTDGALTSSSNVPWYALLRDGPYKYIRYMVEGETEELYDLEKDPDELNNLASNPNFHAQLVQLREKAKAELKRTDAPFVDNLPPTKDELSSKPTQTAAYSIQRHDTKLVIRKNDKTLAEYVFKDDATNKTYLFPIYGPSGTLMARSYPMISDVEGEQHDHPHHRGIWFGHEDIAGFDTWAEKMTFGEAKKKKSSETETRISKLGKQSHAGFRRMVVDSDSASFVEDLDYLSADGKKLFSEVRTIKFHDEGAMRWIDFDQELVASNGDIVLGDKKDAGLSIRVPTSMAVDTDRGGKIVSSEGLTDKDAWGKKARWVNYSGPNPKEPMGVVMLNHPSSFRAPTTWHVRTYGLFTANPFGTLDPEFVNGPYTLKNGEKVSLRHRFVMYSGELSKERIEELYTAYANR